MKTGAHRGRCLCGGVQFELATPPKWITYCHCASCRRHTASPVATFVGFDAAGFGFTADLPNAFESSPGVVRQFCGKCGSPVSYQSDRYPGEIHVYVGVMDDPSHYAPQAHVYFDEHVAWFDTADSLKRHGRTSRG